MSDAQTHDYTTRIKGHDTAIMTVHDNGTLDIVGWGTGIRVGDFLILPNNGFSTRYMVTWIDYYADPPDMWKATLVFAPREAHATA